MTADPLHIQPTPSEALGFAERLDGIDWRVLAGICVGAYAFVTWLGIERMLSPDEVRPLLLANRPMGELLDFARDDMVQTPLSYVVQKLWLDAFGHGDVVAKLLPFVVNATGLVVFAAVAPRLVAGWPLAVVLLTLFYSRLGTTINLVRMYDFVALFAIVALFCWERWRAREQRGWLAGWTVAVIAGIYSHPSAGLLIPGFLLANGIAGKRQLELWLAGTIAAASLLVWVAWVFPVYAGRGLEANVSAVYSPPVTTLARLPFFWLSGEGSLSGARAQDSALHADSLRWTLTWAARLCLAALFAVALRALLAARRSEDRDRLGRQLAVALALWLTPIAVLFVVSLGPHPVLGYRYVLVCFPALCLSLAGMAHAGGPVGRAIGLLVVLPWFAVAAGAAIHTAARPDPIRGAVDRMAEEHQPGDLILADAQMPYGYQVTWEWSRRHGRSEPVRMVRRPMLSYLAERWPGVPLDELQGELRSVDRIWLFRAGTRLPDAREFLLNLGYRGAGPVDDFELLTRAGYEANNTGD